MKKKGPKNNEKEANIVKIIENRGEEEVEPEEEKKNNQNSKCKRN